MTQQVKANTEVTNSIQQIQAHNRMIETQIAQLAQQVSGLAQPSSQQLPGQPNANPSHDRVNAVVLRSGTSYDGPTLKEVEEEKEESSTLGEKAQEVEHERRVESDKDEGVEEPKMTHTPPLPFPQRLAAKKMNEKMKSFLELMKGVQLHIPFLQAISQMPVYAKFLKDLLTRKDKLEGALTTILPDNVSSIVQGKMPRKRSDSGAFVLPIQLGNQRERGALADLGAGVSLMPLSIASSLNYDLIPTNRTIQLADRTVRVPVGELIDVPVQVGKFFIPCDFVVMDMDEDPITPLILGRPFIETARMVFDCDEHTLTVKVGEDEVVFGFPKVMKQPMMEQVMRVDVLEKEAEELRSKLSTDDPL